MIRYDLICAAGHRFDSWFQSSDAFDTLSAKGMVTCTICGTADIRKALMAPGVAVADDPVAVPQTMAAGPLSRAGSEMERMLTELRKTVEENSTYVGRDFAREARQMHLGEVPERQIHGEATPAEARSLVDDGVPVMPLPVIAKGNSN